MKKLIRTVTIMVCFLVLCGGAAQAQGAPVDRVNTAIRTGNVDELVRYFGPVVDITINTSQSTYSNTQGEMVLRDFFNKNAPRDLEIRHTGNSEGSTVYTIGQLTTASGKYKVYISLRQKDNTYTIKEIRIEK